MGQGFAKASQGPVLDQDGLIPQIPILTGFLISTFRYFIRVGTFPDLRLDLFENVFQAILTLLQSDITGRGSLGKGSSEIESGNILSCLMFQFFKNWKRNFAHRSPRWLRRNTNLGKVCIELLYFVLITRLAYLVPLDSGRRWLGVLALR